MSATDIVFTINISLSNVRLILKIMWENAGDNMEKEQSKAGLGMTDFCMSSPAQQSEKLLGVKPGQDLSVLPCSLCASLIWKPFTA